MSAKAVNIVDIGRGPQIKGSRLTVMDVFYYLHLNKLSGIGETARELAYPLYFNCERNKWADEALAYNGLVIAWSELTKLARSAAVQAPAVQPEMF